MTKEQFKRIYEIFRSTCLLYPVEKEELEKLEKQYPSLKNISIEEGKFRIDLSNDYDSGELERYQLLKENVELVENYFRDIREMFGEQADAISGSFLSADAHRQKSEKTMECHGGRCSMRLKNGC